MDERVGGWVGWAWRALRWRSSFMHPVTDVGWALAVGYLLTLVPIAVFAVLAYTARPHHDAGPALLARPAHAPAPADGAASPACNDDSDV